MVGRSPISGKSHLFSDEKYASTDRQTSVDMDGDNTDRICVSTVLGSADDLIMRNNDSKESKAETKHDCSGSVLSIESIRSEEDYKYYERWYTILLQVSIPFLIAGMGTIGAGIILSDTEDYEVFQTVQALYILVPSIIGLKGNLDMCLASRLSTQANLGNIHWNKEMFKLIFGNIGLVQVQAIVAALVVSIYAVIASSLLTGQTIVLENALLVMTSAVLTATISCSILDVLLSAIIIFAHRLKINPDNLATPLAASIGDMISLNFLTIFANLLYGLRATAPWCFYLILGLYVLVMLPAWIIMVKKNEYTKDILANGWVPVMSALFISGASGLMLENAVNEFEGYSIFQPIANGIGGNLVSVQASRTSTMLHRSSIPGILPPHTKQWVWPWTALFYGVLPAQTARLLILISIPGQTLFIFIADLIYNSGESTLTATFVFTYLTIVLLQVMILLYIAHIIIHFMWIYKYDPDNCAIPYLTALGDLIGSGFLLLAFMFLRSIGSEYIPAV